MILDNRHKNTICSIFIIALLTGIAHLIVLEADDFAAVTICFGTFAFALLAAVIFLILRLLKFIKETTNFFYNYIGTLNTCLSFLLLIGSLIDAGIFTTPVIIVMLINFILGFSILIDIYKSEP